MKRQKNYWGITFCAVLLAAGCTQYEAPSVYGTGKGIQVPLEIASAGIQPEVACTRAASELGTGTSIGLFLRNVPGSSGYTPRDNVHYKHTDAGWLFQGAPEDGILLNASDVRLCAYYPYDASVASVTGIRLTPHVLAPGEIPPAYAPDLTINAVDNNVTFSMKQAYTRLAISFGRGNIKDDITLGEFSLINSGLYKESVLDIGGGTIGGNIPADAGAISFTGDIALAKNGTVTRDIVLPPAGALTGGLKVAVKVKEYGNKVLSTTLAGITALERGYKYEVTLTVNGTDLGVSTVNVLPWTDTTVNNGGQGLVPDPTPVIPPGIQVPASDFNLSNPGYGPCTDQDKAALAKLTWAKGNLRQQNDDGSGPVIMAGPAEYGHYYTWNSTYTGNITTNGTDPCTQLNPDIYGVGWRTPGKNELDKLVRCTDMQLVTDNGVKGMWFMNNPKGLFLPAAGLRSDNEGSGTTATYDSGIQGYYWASDIKENGYGYYIIFYTNDAYTYASSKENGRSVRCVHGEKQ